MAMKNPTDVVFPYSKIEWEELKAYNCSRTIQYSAEITLFPELFCQPIDIAIELTGSKTVPIANMDKYPMRSVENALGYIDAVRKSGIRTIMLRMNAPKLLTTIDAVLQRQQDVITRIRSKYDAKSLDIIIDPFSVALNENKTWGILDKNGDLDYIATAQLFSKITTLFANENASYMLTLGRFEREADVTHRTISSLNKPETKVASFSTNTETTNAYVYADHGAYALTRQKILVSNSQEMVFRALVDIHEGSQLIVIKPAENLHILEKIKTVLRHRKLLEEFLISKAVTDMARHSVYLQRIRHIILEDIESFSVKAATVRLGAYTVSGTYFMDMQTKQRKGDAFLKSLLYERFCNIAGVLSEHITPGLIIDRNALWYFSAK